MTDFCRKPFSTGGGWWYCTEPAGHANAWDHRTDTKSITERPVLTLGAVSNGAAHDGTVPVEIWREIVIDGNPVGLVTREKGRPLGEIRRDLAAALHKLDTVTDDGREEFLDEGLSGYHGYGKDRIFRVDVYTNDDATADSPYVVEWSPPFSRTPYKEMFITTEAANAYAEVLRAKYRAVPPELTPVDPSVTDYRRDYEWPTNVRWIAVYPVTGGSEGHYVHVDVIRDIQDTALGSVRTTEIIFTAKTFRGLEHAQKIATAIQKLLGV